MAGKKLMSLEAAMEEERQQIEALLSQQQPKARRPSSISSGRSPSPYVTARSPMRSMLDVAGPPKQSPTQAHTQVRSMLDIGSPVPTAVTPVRSMLDIGSTPSPMPKSPTVSSAQTSPTLSSHRVPAPGSDMHIRSMSDATVKPVLDFGPRSPPLHRDRNVDPTSAYRFSDIYATNVGQARPGARISQANRSSSIGEALRGSDLSNIMLPGEFGRQFNSLRGKSKSKSPSNRFNLRSNSPHGSLLGRSSSRNQDRGTIMLDDGQIIDKNSAYRRLSDAHLIYGGSSLSSLPRKKSDPDGHGRIAKLNMSPYGEILTDDDSDDDVGNSSDEENHRGRKLTTRAESQGDKDTKRSAKSLLAAAEDERKQIASQHQYRSLLDDPEITVTNPNGDKKKSSKRTVQPATSFDQPPLSRSQTPDPNADQEDLDNSAITRAQNLQLSSTAIICNPDVHRSIRIIYRGEFNRIQRSAEEEHRRLRKYLVATDLSDESTHALEWAIGTVLRDGDTLIAIYCMDEEASGSSIDTSNLVPDDPKSMREQAAAINAMAKSTKQQFTSNSGHFHLSRPSPSPLIRASDSGSNTPSPAPSFRGKSRLEEERERAVQDITDRVSKLLRKTQLEVRVIVECIHCKNPKHLITEVIDLVNPTLVVLGSRGRSALKGTLLGSFSNYLVTKSSVPVMVARKRLRKKSKYQAPPRQVNNLTTSSGRILETARID